MVMTDDFGRPSSARHGQPGGVEIRMVSVVFALGLTFSAGLGLAQDAGSASQPVAQPAPAPAAIESPAATAPQVGAANPVTPVAPQVDVAGPALNPLVLASDQTPAEPIPAADLDPGNIDPAGDDAAPVLVDPAVVGAEIPTPAPVRPLPPTDPLGLAIFAALDQRYGSNLEPILAYKDRNYAPVWLTPDGRATPAATALLAALAAAPAHALPPARYEVEKLAAMLSTPRPDPTVLAEAEVALTVVYLRYARDIHSGLLEPRKVDREIILHPERPETGRLIGEIAAAGDPAQTLSALAPSNPRYVGLQNELADITRRTDGWGPQVPAGATLRPDDRSKRIEVLRNRLIAIGDHQLGNSGATGAAVVAANGPSATEGVTTDADPSLPHDPWVYDSALADSVRRFQERHGLNPDGVVGPATLAQINVEPQVRAAQIAVNLERLRWLNRDLGHRRIMVNLADFTMAVFEGEQPIFTSRVVVGKNPKNRTPEFSDEMEYMVVNPSWSVPSSIARDEILPELRADPGYLKRKNMVLVGADASSIDWASVTRSNFPGRIRQGPGNGNALGRVKFMFPNDYAIYLHDTPSKSLFARDVRAFSHGCVRVERPFDFARLLLQGEVEDPEAAFDRWLAAGSERHVTLQAPIPVHLTYVTAWVDESGRRQFRGDIYGRDERVMAALAEAGVSLTH